jgi:hypothetical protein
LCNGSGAAEENKDNPEISSYVLEVCVRSATS